MKHLATKYRGSFVVGVLAAAMAGAVPLAHAQSGEIPRKLTGKWATPDSRDGQRIVVEIDSAKRTATLSLTFADPRCAVRGLPMSVATLGGRVTLKLIDSEPNPCINDMTLEMVPNRNSKGEDGYLAELRLTGSAANRAPILRGRLTLP